MVDSCKSIFLPVFLFWKIVCMWIPFFLSACCEVCLAWYGVFVSNPVTHASVVLYLCLIWYCILKKHRILIPWHIGERNPLLISQPLARPNWAVSTSWGQTERRPRLFTGTKWHVSSLGFFEIRDSEIFPSLYWCLFHVVLRYCTFSCTGFPTPSWFGLYIPYPGEASPNVDSIAFLRVDVFSHTLVTTCDK